MTIDTAAARSVFNCDGVTTVFPVPIQSYQATDFTVLLTSALGISSTLVLNSNYTLAPSGSLQPTAWTLTTSIVYLAGNKLQIFINPQQIQQSQYVQGQQFPSLTLQTNVDRLTQMVQRLQDEVSRAIHAPDGDNAPLMLLPSAQARANLALLFDSSGNATVGTPVTGTITGSLIATLLSAITASAATADKVQTAAEIAAGVTPVNYAYAPGYVDRYATNTAPGTTDMTAAFTTAAQVAFRLGCPVRWGATAPYRVVGPVNWTGIHGVTFTDESSGAASNSAFCSLIVGSTSVQGHVFDLSTSYECTFNNFALTSIGSALINAIFFCARNVAGSGAGIHRFNNIRTSSVTQATAIGYQYASEENIWLNCELYNAKNGSIILSWNDTNPQGWTSTFVTIASGSQSNVEHRSIGCSFFNFGNSGSQNETCLQLVNAGNIKIRDGLFACAHGRSYVDALGTANNFVTLDSIRGEILGGGQQPQYGIYIGATGTSVDWMLNNSQGDAVNEYLHMNTGTSIQNLAMRVCTNSSGKILSAYNMSASIIESMQDSVITGQVGGSVTGNLFLGGRNNITLSGTASGNLYADNFAGGFGIDGDSYISPSTACTGALTVSVSYTVRLMPNGKDVKLNLPAIVGTASAATNFTINPALPVQFRPGATLRQPIIIEDNGGTLNQLGQVIISTAGVITVFKDIVGTATFTAAAGAGLPAETEVGWGL